MFDCKKVVFRHGADVLVTSILDLLHEVTTMKIKKAGIIFMLTF